MSNLQPHIFSETNEINTFIDLMLTHAKNPYYNDFMGFLPNPDPILRDNYQNYDIYKDIASDGFVSGLIEQRKAGTLSMLWDIEKPESENPYTDIVSGIIKSIKDLPNLISNVLDAVFYGFVPIELIWSISDGYYIPLYFETKPQNWFGFNANGEMILRNNNVFGTEILPANKFLTVQYKPSYVNPYGEGILSKCFWSWTFKKGGFKFWAEFVEKYGMPFADGEYPIGKSMQEIQSFANDLAGIVQNGVIVHDNMTKVNLLFANGANSTANYDSFIKHCKDELSVTILGHESAAQSVAGQLGNQNNTQDIRKTIQMSDRLLVESVFNRLIDMIYTVNRFPLNDKPKFILYEENQIEMNLAQRDKLLFDMGIKFTDEYIKKAYYFDDDDFTISDVAPSNPMFSQFAEKKQKSIIDGQNLIDNLTEKSISDSLQIFNDLLNPVKSFIDGKTDFNDALQSLHTLYPEMNTDDLNNELERRIFIANVIGRLSVQSEKGLL